MEKTTVDKLELLQVLYKHGTNIETLKKLLPKWSNSELNAFILRFRTKAHKKVIEDEQGVERTKFTLEKWMDFVDQCHLLQGTSNSTKKRRGRKSLTNLPKDHAPITSKMMMYAACFEEHYQGSEPSDPNYSEIYRHLAQLLEGKEPTQLSPGSAAKVLEMLMRIKKTVNDHSLPDHTQHLKKLPLPHFKIGIGTSDAESTSTEGTGNTSSLEGDPGAADCPLFQDTEEEVRTADLEPEDPYYEVKRAKMEQKFRVMQKEAAEEALSIPGINPLGFQSSLLVKPSTAMVNPSPP